MKGKVVAWMKEWTAEDGSERVRVDLHESIDPWMPKDTKIYPLVKEEKQKTSTEPAGQR